MGDCFSFLFEWIPITVAGRKRRISRLSIIFAMLMLFVSLVALRLGIQHYQQVRKFIRLQGYEMELRQLVEYLRSLENSNLELREEVIRLERVINGTLQELNSPTV